jgi:uncharacterized membrane protein YjgN (DUF898 family)
MISDEEMIKLIKDAAKEGEFHKMSSEEMERIYNDGLQLAQKMPDDDEHMQALEQFRMAIENRKMASRMIRCKKCGKQLRADTVVCPFCRQIVEKKVEASRGETKTSAVKSTPEIKANPSTVKDTIYPFLFQGNGGTLFGIQIVNLLLIIVTLGVYFFWAKARTRAYIWSQVDCNGDRFAYHGTGMEVLIGWVKAALIFGIPFYACQNIPLLIGASKLIIFIGAILSFIIISIFIPVATVGSRRYRLTRSSLRGIRFSFRGKWQEFARIFFSGSALLFLTLGFYMPYFDMRRQTFLIEKSYYGNGKFDFDGQGKDLFGSYFLAVLLAIPTLFISMLWYNYKKTLYTWNHTTFGKARFQCSITFGGVFGLYLVNALILIFTLGFGYPWVKVRNMRYYLENLMLQGQVDLSAIAQDAQEATAFGEEVGDFLSMDFEMG